MGINIFLFVWFYQIYDVGDQYFYTRHLLGVSEGVGRDLVKWLDHVHETVSPFSPS